MHHVIRLCPRRDWLPSLMLLGICGGGIDPGGASAAEADASENEFLQELPVVISPTHLVQPLGDAPVAVTVIDRELIRAMGVREIPELMRRVAGAVVAYDLLREQGPKR